MKSSQTAATAKIVNAKANGDCAFNAFILALSEKPVLDALEKQCKDKKMNIHDVYSKFLDKAVEANLFNLHKIDSKAPGAGETSWENLKKYLLFLRENKSKTKLKKLERLQEIFSPILRSLCIQLIRSADSNTPLASEYKNNTIPPLQVEFDNYVAYLLYQTEPGYDKKEAKKKEKEIGDIFYRHSFIKKKFEELSTEAIKLIKESKDTGPANIITIREKQKEKLVEWWINKDGGFDQFLKAMEKPASQGTEGSQRYAGDMELRVLAEYFKVNLEIDMSGNVINTGNKAHLIPVEKTGKYDLNANVTILGDSDSSASLANYLSGRGIINKGSYSRENKFYEMQDLTREQVEKRLAEIPSINEVIRRLSHEYETKVFDVKGLEDDCFNELIARNIIRKNKNQYLLKVPFDTALDRISKIEIDDNIKHFLDEWDSVRNTTKSQVTIKLKHSGNHWDAYSYSEPVVTPEVKKTESSSHISVDIRDGLVTVSPEKTGLTAEIKEVKVSSVPVTTSSKNPPVHSTTAAPRSASPASREKFKSLTIGTSKEALTPLLKPTETKVPAATSTITLAPSEIKDPAVTSTIITGPAETKAAETKAAETKAVMTSTSTEAKPTEAKITEAKAAELKATEIPTEIKATASTIPPIVPVTSTPAPRPSEGPAITIPASRGAADGSSITSTPIVTTDPATLPVASSSIAPSSKPAISLPPSSTPSRPRSATIPSTSGSRRSSVSTSTPISRRPTSRSHSPEPLSPTSSHTSVSTPRVPVSPRSPTSPSHTPVVSPYTPGSSRMPDIIVRKPKTPVSTASISPEKDINKKLRQTVNNWVEKLIERKEIPTLLAKPIKKLVDSSKMSTTKDVKSILSAALKHTPEAISISPNIQRIIKDEAGYDLKSFGTITGVSPSAEYLKPGKVAECTFKSGAPEEGKYCEMRETGKDLLKVVPVKIPSVSEPYWEDKIAGHKVPNLDLLQFVDAMLKAILSNPNFADKPLVIHGHENREYIRTIKLLYLTYCASYGARGVIRYIRNGKASDNDANYNPAPEEMNQVKLLMKKGELTPVEVTKDNKFMESELKELESAKIAVKKMPSSPSTKELTHKIDKAAAIIKETQEGKVTPESFEELQKIISPRRRGG